MGGLMPPNELGIIQIKGMNPMVTLSQKDQCMRRNRNGKKGGGEAEELQWRDGLIIQHIHGLLTIGMGRMIGTPKKRTTRHLMVDDHCVGGEPLGMGITMGHKRDMEGMDIEMGMIEEKGVTMIRNQGNQRLI